MLGHSFPTRRSSDLILDLVSHVRHRLAAFDVEDAPSAFASRELQIDPETGDALLLDPVAGALLHMPLEPNIDPYTLSGTLYGEGPSVFFGRLGQSVDAKTVYALDPFEQAIASVDVRTGDRAIVSSDDVGEGDPFVTVDGIAHDAAGQRLIVLDDPQLLAVELATGDRTVLSRWADPLTGVGPALGLPHELSSFVDNARNAILVVSGDRLLSIDLTSGDRTEFSGPGRGTGFLPTEFRSVTYFDGFYYATCNVDEVIELDPTTGNRTVISGASIDSEGPILVQARGLAPDPSNHALLVFDADALALLSIDIASGQRRVVRTDAHFDFVVDPVQGRLIFSDANLKWAELAARGYDAIYAPPSRGELPTVPALSGDASSVCGLQLSSVLLMCVDLETSDLQRFDSHDAPPDIPWSSFFDEGENVLYVASISIFNQGHQSVVAYDFDTGDHTLISDDTVGTGVLLRGPVDGAFDPEHGRLLVLDYVLPALMAIDSVTGDRTNLSGGASGDGPAWQAPLEVKYDQSEDRALVIDSFGLVAVDLESGDRTLLSGDADGDGAGEPVGAGPVAAALIGFTIDAEHDRVIARDLELGLLAIDLETGDRTMLFENAIPASDLPPLFLRAYAEMAYLPERQTILYVGSGTAGALIEVDERSGDWTVLLGRIP